MRLVGRTLGEYFAALKKFLAIIFIMTAILVALRLSVGLPSEAQGPLVGVGGIIIGWGGWSAVRNHGFNLKQVGFGGFLLSFGGHWALPIFHNPLEVVYLFFVNSVLYAAIAIVGGWLATLKKH